MGDHLTTKWVETRIALRSSLGGSKMKCVRCEENKEAQYRVFSDILDLKVCADCAAEAGRLNLGIELLQQTNDPRTDEYMRKAS